MSNTPNKNNSKLQFCPVCGNLMLLDSSGSKVSLQCRNCELRVNYEGHTHYNAEFEPLDVKAFISEQDTSMLQVTEEQCPKCGFGKAFFNEVQIRSADEPATIFYTCQKCHFRWRVG